MSVLAEQISEIEKLPATEGLARVLGFFPGKPVFSTSFGAEDQAITHLIATASLSVQFFTLDTGRLFPETYSTWSATIEKYPVRIEAFYPDEEDIRQWVSANGPNAFYQSPELRKACCRIRKVDPLHQALKGASVWITGIRAAQSANRESLSILEWDDHYGVVKYHPLLYWTDQEVWHFLQQHEVPVNPLHDKGFVSIGCAPCTRAIRPGEDFRAGRWWWEDNSRKECGLHVNNH
jgi:phosphoadenosine phosphosulfate reductase